MKVAFFSKIPVFPAHGGNRARIKNLCVALERAGCVVDFFLIPSRQMRDCDIAAHEAYFGAGRMHVLDRSAVHGAAFFLTALYWILVGKLTKSLKLGDVKHDDVDYLFPGGIDAQVRCIAAADRFDIAIVTYVHFTKIFESFGAETYRVLDTHDSFAGEFTPGAETRGFLRADAVLAIQDDEAAIFRRQLGADAGKVRVLSHFVEPKDRLSLDSTRGATFIGSSFAANRISINYFLESVLPLILSRVAEFKIFIAGTICNDIEDRPGVVKLGRVENVKDAFAQAPILINPIRSGTGVKIKLLEAMAMGLPTVSTESGVRGLEERFLSGVVRVADDDAAAFASAVIRLYDNRGDRSRLGEAAFAAARGWTSRQDGQLQEVLDAARDTLSARAGRPRGPASAASPPAMGTTASGPR